MNLNLINYYLNQQQSSFREDLQRSLQEITKKTSENSKSLCDEFESEYEQQRCSSTGNFFCINFVQIYCLLAKCGGDEVILRLLA
jgi:hypothetical protein